MSPGSIVLWLLSIGLPVGAFFGILVRSERRPLTLRIAFGTAVLGALAFVPAAIVERWIVGLTGLGQRSPGATDTAALVYAFFVAAPLEQGLKVAAVAPVWRTSHLHRPIDGILFASAAALGFVTANNALFLWGRALPSIDLVRALLAVPANLFFAAAWGYALGRDPDKRLGGRLFNATWLGATIFSAAYGHIVFGRGPTALFAAVPVLLVIGFVAFLGVRDLWKRSLGPHAGRPRRRILPSIAPPSLGAMREALRRAERPVMFAWIALGALVTTGVMTASLACAVLLGHRLGLDFAEVDRGESSPDSAAPLILLGAAALLSFPVAGYLIARASAARSVLEPAISTALSIVGTLVLLGLAAPIAVVFALAFAPLAFGLACAGAWMGMVK